MENDPGWYRGAVDGRAFAFINWLWAWPWDNNWWDLSGFVGWHLSPSVGCVVWRAEELFQRRLPFVVLGGWDNVAHTGKLAQSHQSIVHMRLGSAWSRRFWIRGKRREDGSHT